MGFERSGGWRGLLRAGRLGPVLVLIWLFQLPLSAQQPSQPQDKAERTVHRFWDKTNVALTVLEGGAMTFDGATTQHALRKYPDGREGNPLARPFVERGWPGQIAGGAIVISSEVGVRYLLHKRGRHRLERILPLVLTAAHTAFGIRNYYLVRRRDQLR